MWGKCDMGLLFSYSVFGILQWELVSKRDGSWIFHWHQVCQRYLFHLGTYWTASTEHTFCYSHVRRPPVAEEPWEFSQWVRVCDLVVGVGRFRIGLIDKRTNAQDINRGRHLHYSSSVRTQPPVLEDVIWWMTDDRMTSNPATQELPRHVTLAGLVEIAVAVAFVLLNNKSSAISLLSWGQSESA